MQGVSCYSLLSDGEFRLELSPTTTSPEPTHIRIQRLINENTVIIFTRSACYMCDVIKHLFCSIGVYPTVIQLEEHEISYLAALHHHGGGAEAVAPAVFIGGTSVGGLESLVALHLSGHLVSKLVQVGALQGMVL